ncbi:MAG TPA: methylated-DNA--[protein]-cysteine S-methyltransferase [Micromonosporaceae bacterium]
MTTWYATVATPAGPFTVLTDEDHVLASGWTSHVDDLLPLVHPSLRPDTPRATADLGTVTKAVAAYLDGDLDAPAAIPVRQRGGEFLSHAWQVLRGVPPGEPVSYTGYAALAGRPAAVRAAAQACARNAAALYVPCHRVIRVGGALGGFRWGLPVKRWLLDHESA